MFYLRYPKSILIKLPSGKVRKATFADHMETTANDRQFGLSIQALRASNELVTKTQGCKYNDLIVLTDKTYETTKRVVEEPHPEQQFLPWMARQILPFLEHFLSAQTDPQKCPELPELSPAEQAIEDMKDEETPKES